MDYRHYDSPRRGTHMNSRASQNCHYEGQDCHYEGQDCHYEGSDANMPSSDYFGLSPLGSSQRTVSAANVNNMNYKPCNSSRNSWGAANCGANNCGLLQSDSSSENKNSLWSRATQILKPTEYADAAGTETGRFVSQLVNNNSVVVFSKSNCPHCIETKNTLNGKGVSFKTVELDKMSNGEGPMVQNVLQEMTNARTVPRIFIDGNCVGGNSDLKMLNASGQLEKLLSSKKSRT